MRTPFLWLDWLAAGNRHCRLVIDKPGSPFGGSLRAPLVTVDWEWLVLQRQGAAVLNLFRLLEMKRRKGLIEHCIVNLWPSACVKHPRD